MAKFDPVLPKKHVVAGKYIVIFPLKQGTYAESYRVRDRKGNPFFLKLFFYDKLADYQIDGDGNIVEIEVLKGVDAPNIVKLLDSGDISIEGKMFAYAVYDFIAGETLADKMGREDTINPYDAKYAILNVLEGLHTLHTKADPVVHNEITNLNIMTDLSGPTTQYKIIDFGYAQFLNRTSMVPDREGLDLYYRASETFEGNYSVQSDIFSVGALYYHLLFGMPPYFVEQNKFAKEEEDMESALLKAREQNLRIVSTQGQLDAMTLGILAKALHPQPAERFASATDFISALKGELEVGDGGANFVTQTGGGEGGFQATVTHGVGEGEGFSAIAGMADLKETITHDVINALKEKEKYAEYGLTIPNGMLFYGPPGCGKTFFAERMAEEIGFSFFPIKPSDIQSKYVNATQEKIGQLFDEARANAPSIIFLDELDAMMPKRDTPNMSQMNANAVNEFLAQMNNSGEQNVFIIGATNRPTAVDPAVLRSGRLDKIFYVPPPDEAARGEMFRIHLQKRPLEGEMDYDEFAKATENFVSSDIKFLCDEAARRALRSSIKITSATVLETIQANRPSLNQSVLESYKKIRAELEGTQREQRSQIGFNRN